MFDHIWQYWFQRYRHAFAVCDDMGVLIAERWLAYYKRRDPDYSESVVIVGGDEKFRAEMKRKVDAGRYFRIALNYE